MLGCDYHCGYCQNWVTSQALRDPVAGAAPIDFEPAELVALAKRTADAAPELVDQLENKAVRCYSCGHRCKILNGLNGICKVRYNEDGVLRVPRGYAAALQIDPIE